MTTNLHNMNSFSGYDVNQQDVYYLSLPVDTMREYVKQAIPTTWDNVLYMFRVTASLRSLWSLQDACGDNTGFCFSIFHK